MESLYRKYRPLTFDSVVGQQHIVSTLEHAVTEGRLSHAYLFCGPRGTGKTTMARILAKALLCQGAEAARANGASGCMPDGDCPECQAIAEGTHPDVYELDAASRTGVDNVREEIINSVSFAPVRGAYKIYIIDEAHMLTAAAFNALLKTLEEPPAHVVFVLCTTDPQQILETILSRCQRFDFHRISNDDIVGRMRFICEKEGFEFDEEALQIVARHARGGMRDALSTLEQLSVFGDGAVRVSDARSLLGEVASTVLADFTRGIAARDIPGLYVLIRSQAEEGNDLMELTRDLIAHVRDVYTASIAGGKPELFDGTPDEVAAYVEEAGLFEGPDRIARVLTGLDDAALEMRSATDPRLVLEIACTRLARPETDLTLEALAERVDRLERQLAAGVPSAPMGEGELAAAMGRTGQSGAASHAATPNARPAAPAASQAPAASAIQKPAAATAQAPAASAVPMPAVPGAPVQPNAASVSHAAVAPQAVPTAAPVVPPAAPAHSPADSTRSSAAPASRPMPTPAPAPVHEEAKAAAGHAAPAPQVPHHERQVQPEVSLDSFEETAAVTDGGELQRKWAEAVRRVIKAQASRGALLQNARAASDDGSKLVVEFPRGSMFALKMVNRPDTQSLVLPIICEVFGRRTVEYVMDGGEAPRKAASRAPDGAPAAQGPASRPAAPVPASQAKPQTAAPAPAVASASSAPASAPSEPASPVSAASATAASSAHAVIAGPSAPAIPAAATPSAPVAQPAAPVSAEPVDQMSSPTIVPEPDVDAQREAWESEQVPYDDATIASYEDDELPPFDAPSSEPPVSAANAGPTPATVSGSVAASTPVAAPSTANGPAAPASAANPFAHPTPEVEVPQTVEEAKEMLGSIFGAGVVFKEVDE